MTETEEQSSAKSEEKRIAPFKEIGRILEYIFLPIKENASFFFFMYLLGTICGYLSLNPNEDIYSNIYLELFLDLYVMCIILTFIPNKIRIWIKTALYIILYSVAIIDIYCFVKFDSTLTPTMLLFVGATDA